MCHSRMCVLLPDKSIRVQAGKDVTPRVTKKKPKPPKVRRPPFSFDRAGVPVGATIIAKRTGEKATVVGTRVRFRGKEMSLTTATKLVVGHSTQLKRRWTFKGRTLKELHEKAVGPKKKR